MQEKVIVESAEKVECTVPYESNIVVEEIKEDIENTTLSTG